MQRILILLLALAALTLSTPLARAGNLCTPDNATLEPLPAALVPQAEQLFGLHNVDNAWVESSTVVRCMGGKLLACNYGANLPCGKANLTTTLPAGGAWCAANPDADFIPAYITGHDSVWQWRCIKGMPTTTGPRAPVDAQGYLTRYWKVIS